MRSTVRFFGRVEIGFRRWTCTERRCGVSDVIACVYAKHVDWFCRRCLLWKQDSLCWLLLMAGGGYEFRSAHLPVTLESDTGRGGQVFVHVPTTFLSPWPWVCLCFGGCMIYVYVHVCFVLPWSVESFPFMFWRWRNKLKWAPFEFFAPSPLFRARSWLHPFYGHCEQQAMRDEAVIYVAGHPLLNRRCTILPRCIRLRNDLYCVGWGVKLYSLTPQIRKWKCPPFLHSV